MRHSCGELDGALLPIFLERDGASSQRLRSGTAAFFMRTWASDAEIHIHALQGLCVAQQQSSAAGKVLELRKAPGSGPLSYQGSLSFVWRLSLLELLTMLQLSCRQRLHVRSALGRIGNTPGIVVSRVTLTEGRFRYFYIQVPEFNQTHPEKF